MHDDTRYQNKSSRQHEDNSEDGKETKFLLMAKILLLWLLAVFLLLIHACNVLGEGFTLFLFDLKTHFADNPEMILYCKNKLILLTAGCAFLLIAAFFTEDFLWKIKILKWSVTLSPQSKRFRRGCNLGLAAVSLGCVVVGVLFLKPQIQSYPPEERWRGDTLIAHACGGINGCSYSNSVEAFEQSYANGIRSIEVDFQFTSDDKLVCCHSWDGQLCNGYEADHIYSEEEFLNIRIYDQFTTMSLEDLFGLMKKYTDVWIVTDTKYPKTEDIQKEFEILLKTAKATNSMDVLDRFVVQLYNYEMYDVVEQIYPFPSYLLTLYMIGGTDPESFTDHCRFLFDRKIGAVTMWNDWVTPEVMEIANRYGISVYAHTLNCVEDIEELKAMGVRGFYTDDVTPEML